MGPVGLENMCVTHLKVHGLDLGTSLHRRHVYSSNVGPTNRLLLTVEPVEFEKFIETSGDRFGGIYRIYLT